MSTLQRLRITKPKLVSLLLLLSAITPMLVPANGLSAQDITTTLLTDQFFLFLPSGSQGLEGMVTSKCGWGLLTFQANKGDYITGSFSVFTADISGKLGSSPFMISFYIVTSAEWEKWHQDFLNWAQNPVPSTDPCLTGPPSLQSANSVSSYSFGFVVPSGGKYALVFLNRSNYQQAGVVLSTNLKG